LIGALFEDAGGKTQVAAIETGSPAVEAGLRPGDTLDTLDGQTVNAAGVAQALAARRPGDRVTLVLARGTDRREVVVTLGDKHELSYRLRPIANPTPLQAAILRSWVQPTVTSAR